jgi:uncharacterized protein with von Willebrand factor type A (vWA) domain
MDEALADLIATLRRQGLLVSTSESIDALRAVQQMGLGSRDDLRRALSATLVKSFRDLPEFERAFQHFFRAQGESSPDWFGQLRAKGFTPDEVAALKDIVDGQAGVQHGAPLYRALSEGGGSRLEDAVRVAASHAGVTRVADPERVGFYTMRLLDSARMSRAEAQLSQARSQLRDAFGERGDALADELASALQDFRVMARDFVRASAEAEDEEESLEHTPFGSLNGQDAERVEREVLALSRRLLGRSAMERKRARRGRLLAGPTMRRSLRTGGVPFQPRYRRRAARKARVVVLCDVSDSVRASVRFMLLFLHAAQRAFADARSFVFVRDVREATAVFRDQPVARALELACQGGLVDVAENSAYGAVFRRFLCDFRNALDARTTLIIIGDGRSNHGDAGLGALKSIAMKVQRVVWLVPEQVESWKSGDSDLPLYRKYAHAMLPMTDLASLRVAVRLLARR